MSSGTPDARPANARNAGEELMKRIKQKSDLPKKPEEQELSILKTYQRVIDHLYPELGKQIKITEVRLTANGPTVAYEYNGYKDCVVGATDFDPEKVAQLIIANNRNYVDKTEEYRLKLQERLQKIEMATSADQLSLVFGNEEIPFSQKGKNLEVPKTMKAAYSEAKIYLGSQGGLRVADVMTMEENQFLAYLKTINNPAYKKEITARLDASKRGTERPLQWSYVNMAERQRPDSQEVKTYQRVIEHLYPALGTEIKITDVRLTFNGPTVTYEYNGYKDCVIDATDFDMKKVALHMMDYNKNRVEKTESYRAKLEKRLQGIATITSADRLFLVSGDKKIRFEQPGPQLQVPKTMNLDYAKAEITLGEHAGLRVADVMNMDDAQFIAHLQLINRPEYQEQVQTRILAAQGKPQIPTEKTYTEAGRPKEGLTPPPTAEELSFKTPKNPQKLATNHQ